ncbi:protein FAR1-RELATED SEQUENCE 5-like [Vicia villosa]|uniref:protein FAR1-RELATED SEQUENCE 5-like n=1 Tax=Vicia villosa TaxID=3911 RepID=UPI00273C1AD0|nr:protein FAR1-RELATED SEQUENCE 5-like [Vicia villosa]
MSDAQSYKLDKDLVGHDILGRLKDDERKFVNDMTEYNMTPRYVVSALKDKDPKNLTSITQIYRARATYRLGKRGAMTEMQMLLSLIHQEKYMCWSRNKENSYIVADIFWTHPDSVKLLNMFPQVLIFDCTYKINRYRLPLLEIVGVTSTKLTFSVAFAYLEHEREKNFTWALQKLKELFYSEKLLSNVLGGVGILEIEEHVDDKSW